VKIAICSPVHDSLKADHVNSLTALLIETAKAGVEVAYRNMKSSTVVAGRTLLAQSALDWGADLLLWLDADQTFPPDTLSRLVEHGEDFVGCNYSRKSDPASPTALRLGAESGRDLVWTASDSSGLIEVDAMGMGVCLVARCVFEAVPAPWFSMEWDSENRLIGEDHYFCRKARAAGFKVKIDQGLSGEIGHIGERIFTNMHANMDRARWQMLQRKSAT
jgi:hypothetical protein